MQLAPPVPYKSSTSLLASLPTSNICQHRESVKKILKITEISVKKHLFILNISHLYISKIFKNLKNNSFLCQIETPNRSRPKRSIRA